MTDSTFSAVNKAIKKHLTALHSMVFLMHTSKNVQRENNYKKACCTKTLLTNMSPVTIHHTISVPIKTNFTPLQVVILQLIVHFLKCHQFSTN